MSKSFTFGILTYNHENYIVQQLESIKNQIELYGHEYDNYLLVSDDCSKDRTLLILEKWIQVNKGIFKNINVIKAKENQGIVKNYIKVLKAIETDYFKILAGDDMYYKNNIYRCINVSDILLTPTIKFNNKGFVFHNPWFYIKLRDINEKKIAFFLHNISTYKNYIEAPGVFWNKKFISNSLFNCLAPYTLIEDVPLWKYLFSQSNISVKYVDIPFVLYRQGSGVSTSDNSIIHPLYVSERAKTEKNIYTKKNKGILKKCFWTAYYDVQRIVMKIKSKISVKQQEKVKKMMDEKTDVNEFLMTIEERSLKYEL